MDLKLLCAKITVEAKSLETALYDSDIDMAKVFAAGLKDLAQEFQEGAEAMEDEINAKKCWRDDEVA